MNLYTSPFFAIVATMVAVLGTLAIQASRGPGPTWHRVLEGRALIFTVFVVIAGSGHVMYHQGINYRIARRHGG